MDPERRRPLYRHLYAALRNGWRTYREERAREQLLQQWAHHAEARTLDWQWDDVRFNRIALVNLLLSRKPGGWYLEIGCAGNELFDSVPAAEKVGVDPARGGTERMTSDEFFARNRRQFDVIFIDGLHTYAQVRNDVIHALECLAPGGWIALHDLLPANWQESHVPLVSHLWTGDVWKVAFELAQTTGVEFKILRIEHGVGVLRVTRPPVTLRDLTSLLEAQQFGYFVDHLSALPIVEWNEAQPWLRGSG